MVYINKTKPEHDVKTITNKSYIGKAFYVNKVRKSYAIAITK